MAVFFPIDDLRTLVARALERDNYLPNQSKRIRAVPDIRTIRYYTTLGLIDRPAEMRGRTVLYEPRHVMQLVAIKRLQAANQTLSDVQSRLVGITNNQLTTLADLPQDFWESAERYLARQHTSPGSLADSPGATENELKSPSEDDEVKREFWDQTAALPHSGAGEISGFGALRTSVGNLPLKQLQYRTRIVGLAVHATIAQTYYNPFDECIEATYIFRSKANRP